MTVKMFLSVIFFAGYFELKLPKFYKKTINIIRRVTQIKNIDEHQLYAHNQPIQTQNDMVLFVCITKPTNKFGGWATNKK